MKKIILITLLSAITLSCGGNEDDPIPSASNCKITNAAFVEDTSNGYGNLTSYAITYTGNNITKMDGGSTVYLYEYNGNLLKRHRKYVGGQLKTVADYLTDQTGQVLRMDFDHYNGSIIASEDHITFTYAAPNKLIRMFHYHDTDDETEEDIYITWTGDNPTKYESFDENNILQWTTNFTYDLNKENKFNQNFKNFMFYEHGDDWIKHVMYQSKNEMTFAGFIPSSPPGNFNITYNYYQNSGFHTAINYQGSIGRKFDYNCN